jgi:hypothetical protein
MRKVSMILWLGALLLAGCGGSSTSLKGTGCTSNCSTTTLQMGSGSGSSFDPGAIAVSTKSLSAGGSTSLQVAVVDQTGAAYTTPTAITFNSPCVGEGLATITATGTSPASATVTTSTGVASATYVAAGCSGSDVITATATANSQSLSASATVTVAQAAIGSIQFISATPSTISLKGVGSAGGSATSTVVFKVLDTSGGPRADATVTFALNTTVGGITLSPTSATTDANGQVQTIVSGGTVATTVRVTASTVAGSQTISTESNQLTVSTGIPASNNISLAVGGTGSSSSTSTPSCPNVEAWDIDNVTVPVLLSMTDRFSNPVPDGTTANFRTTLGGIQPSCQTVSGKCTVNWTSETPYTRNGNPQSTTGNANTRAAYCTTLGLSLGLCNGTTNGRSPILATAIGEESFVDANGNGIFDAGDTVAFDATDADNNFASGKPKPWQDTSEPFLNEWEIYDSYGTPTFFAGEPFIDFNNNGQRDGPDGLFNGPLCEGSLCSTTQTSVAIGAHNVIVLSGSTANLSILYASNPETHGAYPVGTGLTLEVEIFDDRLQQMPGGTVVKAALSTGSTASITGPVNFTWPCTTAPPYVNSSGQTIAGQALTYTIAPPSTPPTVVTNLVITVTSPLQLVTTFTIPISP